MGDANISDVTNQEIAAVARLAALPCTGCYGDELLMQNAEGDRPCIHCRNDQDQPTGRRFPGLRWRCGCDGYEAHIDCDGTGWLIASPAEALYWLLGQGFIWLFFPRAKGDCRAVRKGIDGEGPTPLLALIAAIEAAE